MMRTRWSIVVLALLATLLAVACGSGDDDNGSKATASPAAPGAAATTGTGTQSAAGTTAPSLSANVGVVFTLSGANAAFGQSQQKGVQLAQEEINSKNAVPGVRVNLTIEDDAGDRNQGINIFNKFLGQGSTLAIIGPTLSNTALATDPLAQEKKVPVLGVSNTAQGITDIGDYIFRDSLT